MGDAKNNSKQANAQLPTGNPPVSQKQKPKKEKEKTDKKPRVLSGFPISCKEVFQSIFRAEHLQTYEHVPVGCVEVIGLSG